MIILGLDILDWIVILLYALGMAGVALWARRRVRDTSDFYQGNRTFGRSLMAFLNFGSMTDATQTSAVTGEVYRQGLQGVWFQNLVLFHTPFQWFISSLQRRARYLAPGDMYMHRYESRFLAGLYAAVLLAIAIYANSFSYLLTGKTLEAIMTKPAAEYTVAERQSVEFFTEMKRLEKEDPTTLAPPAKTRLLELQELSKKGEIRSFISYLDLDSFYLVYAGMIALYTILGGLFAVAIIDVVQGVLIVFLSLSLLPVALARIGGIDGLVTSVASDKFDLFGSSATSDYTWYFVASLAFLNLVVNAPKSFMIGGAAKDDRSARIGFVSGAIFKRLMMIGWAFTGLLAIGIYSGGLSDPSNVWGFMTHDLLGAGAVGLMIAAIFSANMDGSSTSALESSSAVVKNIILPLRPATTERAQMIFGRILVGLVLGVSVFFASRTNDIVGVFKYILSVGSIVGPSFWIAYFWRRVNTRAVATQMIISIILTIVLPNLVPELPGATTDPALTMQTTERFVETEARATQEEVTAGRASMIGERVTRRERVAPTAIYYASVVRSRPGDTTSTWEGKGIFRPQIWFLSRLGIDFTRWNKAGIDTAGFLFDAIVPFILLITLSFFTRKNSEPVLRDFYARIHTPAVADPELDARLVREKIERPELVEQNKIFPGTNLEFWKPTRFDVLGFLACILFVLGIIGLFKIVEALGR